MSGVNPQGVHVHSFKTPSAEELDHDYLWRCARHLPGARRDRHLQPLALRGGARGPRAPGVPRGAEAAPDEGRAGDIWERRYRAINDWERHLVENGFRIVKLFLNISKEEQRQRFIARIDEPDKNWKFSAGDVKERERWDDYQEAFSEMLSHTSTEWAPWYVIPGDRKWFARVAAAAVIVDALVAIDPQYPEVDDAERAALLEARAGLEAEAEDAGKG